MSLVQREKLWPEPVDGHAKLSWRESLGGFEHFPYAWWAGSLLSFFALAAVAFCQYRQTLFYRFDGSFILTHAVTQPRWAAPGFGLSAHFLDGIGDLWFPIATRWDPGFFFGGLFDQRVMPVIAS